MGGGAKHTTNAEVAELLTRVEAALKTHAPAPESSATFQPEDHDALVSLVTKMEFVEAAAKRWDDNHTVVSNLKQRVTLLSWLGGGLTLTALGEGLRRAITHFT
jgi:hypothetical protein